MQLRTVLELEYTRLFFILPRLFPCGIFSGGPNGKEPTCNAGDLGLTPRSGRSLGEGSGNPLQYYCLENPMDRETWRARVHRVTESVTTEQLTLFHFLTIQQSILSFIMAWLLASKKSIPSVQCARAQQASASITPYCPNG